MISFGRYSFCLLDLVTDDKSGRLSATKIWLHVGNTIMSKVMLDQHDIGSEVLFTYGAIVCGSYAGMFFLKRKYDVPSNTDVDQK